MTSTWDQLKPEERAASGKGYDRPSKTDVVDEEPDGEA